MIGMIVYKNIWISGELDAFPLYTLIVKQTINKSVFDSFFHLYLKYVDKLKREEKKTKA